MEGRLVRHPSIGRAPIEKVERGEKRSPDVTADYVGVGADQRGNGPAATRRA